MKAHKALQVVSDQKERCSAKTFFPFQDPLSRSGAAAQPIRSTGRHCETFSSQRTLPGVGAWWSRPAVVEGGAGELQNPSASHPSEEMRKAAVARRKVSENRQTEY